LPYKVVKSIMEGKKVLSTEDVALFDDSQRAYSHAQNLANTQPLREMVSGQAKVEYDVQVTSEEPKNVPHFVGAPANTKPTISELIATAILTAGGRAKLPQIYPVVKRVRPEVSDQSIRGDLYHGTDADKFRRNTDGTYSLGSKLKREILSRPVEFRDVHYFGTSTPFQGVVSVPSEGVIFGTDPVSYTHLTLPTICSV